METILVALFILAIHSEIRAGKSAVVTDSARNMDVGTFAEPKKWEHGSEEIISRVNFDLAAATAAQAMQFVTISRSAKTIFSFAQSFADHEVSIAAHDKAWAETNGNRTTLKLAQSGLQMAGASKKAAEAVFTATKLWSQTQFQVHKQTIDKYLSPRPNAQTKAKEPYVQFLPEPLQDLLETYTKCTRCDDCAPVNRISSLASMEKTLPLALLQISTKQEPIKAAAEDTSSTKTSDLLAEKNSKPASRNSQNNEIAPSIPIVKLANSTAIGPKLQTNNRSFSEDGIQKALRLLFNNTFLPVDLSVAHDIVEDVRRFPNSTVAALFHSIIDLIHAASNASLQAENDVYNVENEARLALHVVGSFAAKAKGTELNAQQLLLAFRHHFDGDLKEAVEYASSLAETYNSKRKEKDQFLHEREVESFILMRIRKKAKQVAINYTKTSENVRKNAISFVHGFASKSVEHAECSKQMHENAKQLQVKTTQQQQRCRVELLTMRAIAAKMEVVEASNNFFKKMFIVVGTLESTADELSELRARKPDLPIESDLRVVRAWADTRVRPLIDFLKQYNAALFAEWQAASNGRGFTKQKRDNTSKRFSRILGLLNSKTNDLNPQLVSLCCNDNSEFLEVSSNIRVRMQNRARLRGKSIHSQQSVLTDASVPLVRKTVVANRIPDEVARLASMLDEAVNTDFARNLQKLTAQTIQISKTRDQIVKKVKTQNTSFQALKNGMANSTPAQINAALQQVDTIRNNFSKSISRIAIDEMHSTCWKRRTTDHIVQTLVHFSAAAKETTANVVSNFAKIAKLAVMWASLPTPAFVHHNIVDIAERRSLEILNATGIHANISAARVEQLQGQLKEAIRSSEHRTEQLEDWLKVIHYAQQDARDGKGGILMHSYITKLLALRSESLERLAHAYEDIKNVSKQIIAELEQHVEDKKFVFLGQVSNLSDHFTESSLERVELTKKAEAKSKTVDDLRIQLANEMLHIKTLENELQDAHKVNPIALQPLSHDEIAIEEQHLTKLKQKSAETSDTLLQIKKELRDIQTQIAALPSLETDARQSDSYQNWANRVEKSLTKFKKRIEDALSRLVKQKSVITVAEPLRPEELESVLGRPLPHQYTKLYYEIHHAATTISTITEKLRLAEILRQKLSLAKAYRDSKTIELQLQAAHDAFEQQAKPLRLQINKTIPKISFALHSMGQQLHAVAMAELASMYFRKWQESKVLDKKMSAEIVSLLAKARKRQALAHSLSDEMREIQNKREQLNRTLETTAEQLRELTTNTTGLEDSLKNSTEMINKRKNALIEAMLSLNMTATNTSDALDRADEQVHNALKKFKDWDTKRSKLSENLSRQRRATHQICMAAKNSLYALHHLSSDQRELVGLTVDSLDSSYVSPCKQAFGLENEVAQQVQKVLNETLKAKWTLEEFQRIQTNTSIRLGREMANLAKMKTRLAYLAKYQAGMEARFHDAVKNTLRFKPEMLRLQEQVSYLRRRGAQNRDRLVDSSRAFKVAKLAAQQALVAAKLQMDKHKKREKDVQDTMQQYLRYRTSDAESAVEAIQHGATLSAEASQHLSKMIELLRSKEERAIDSQMSALRKLAQAFQNAFTCTDCKSIDTNVLYERPPIHDTYDERNGQAYEDKNTAIHMHSKIDLEAQHFAANAHEENAAWSSFRHGLQAFTDLPHLQIFSTSPQNASVQASTTPGAANRTTIRSKSDRKETSHDVVHNSTQNRNPQGLRADGKDDMSAGPL